ncbi:hypothetical protein MNB_SM-3-1181 [hydrothermal vent metagenome]|uniref:TonB-dependent receptor n=1 Tax=hydrothermal vent metagenome TaxID=652676 RepID=A0A1W1D3T1_9ZZZZ
MIKKTLLLGMFGISLFAGEDIDTLLDAIAQKTDLSEKTKLANSGVCVVWTRNDLQKMQITNLKQILKTLYPFGYDENRYGLSDPLGFNSNQPFVSQSIRLFIDNQEITSGLYGSGLFLMGDSDIDWVDHIEIYTQAPTYEYATESTIVLIKLYSKSIEKDEGSNVKLSAGSYGAWNIDGYNAGWIDDEWNYFAFGLYGDDKRQKHKSFQTTLSRDKNIGAVIATLHSQNANILLNAFTQDRDGFANVSIDATPTTSKIQAKYLHLGVDGKVNNFGYLLSYSYTNTKSDMDDDVTPQPTGVPIAMALSYEHDYVLTSELKYHFKIEKNKLLVGTKYREKYAKWDKSNLNGMDMTKSRGVAIQNIATLYAENQYFASSQSIFNMGVEFQRVTNSDSVQNDNLLLYRTSYTYTTDNWTFKTLYSHVEVAMENYLIGSYTFLANPLRHYDLEKIDAVVENIIYQNGSNRFEGSVDYTYGENYYLPLDGGKIVNYDKNLKMLGMNISWTKHYDDNKIFLKGSVREIKNTPYFLGTYKEYQAIIRTINSYKKYDFFHELVYNRDNVEKENFYNYSLGLHYYYDDDMVISLKGNNIFDDARVSEYYRYNPTNFTQEQPLKISPIDREITLSVDWTFE